MTARRIGRADLKIICCGWDLALSKKESADRTAGVCLGADQENNIYFLDAVRGRWTFDETVRQIHAMAVRWNPHSIGVEESVMQNGAVEEAARRWMLPMKALPVLRRGDNVERARLLEARAALGKVFRPAFAQWWPDLAAELAYFPQGAHDDMVDAAVHALRLIAGLTLGRAVAAPPAGAVQISGWQEGSLLQMPTRHWG